MKSDNDLIILLPYKLRKSLNQDDIVNYFEKQRKVSNITFMIAFPLAIVVFLLLFISDVKGVTPILIISQLLLILLFFIYNRKQFNFSKDDIKSAIDNYVKTTE